MDCTPTFGFLKVSRGETIGVEESLKFKNYHDFEKHSNNTRRISLTLVN